jgi:hypothetical protein
MTPTMTLFRKGYYDPNNDPLLAGFGKTPAELFFVSLLQYYSEGMGTYTLSDVYMYCSTT